MTSDGRNIIDSIVRDADAVKIRWADGHLSTFHHMWLRDNCACARCGEHVSGSRFQALLDIPDDIAPSAIAAEASGLAITWANDRHESRYKAEWLRRYCYSDVERARRRRKKILWDSSLHDLPTVDYRLVETDVAERRKLFASVAEYGFVIVRHVGVECRQTERLAGTIGYIRDTHFGRVTDLRLRTNGSHLSDFPTQILPHSDETYRPVPTGINIFHCIKPSDDGGGVSILVDGHQCVERLRAEDPEAFALLCRLPIQHERMAEGEMIRSNHPAFTLDRDGEISEVRLNERTMSALSVPEEHMEAAYRALRRAFRVAYDPSNCIRHRLAAGEALVLDNLRALHGRTTFTGERLVRQSNVIRDEFYARLAFLEQENPDPEDARWERSA